MANYAMTITLSGSIEEIRARVQQALTAQGFGILTEIDVQQTLQKKLNISMPPYLILGACNPQLASQAIAVDPSLGLLLPCNVVLRQIDQAVEVSIIDPEAMFSVVDPSVQQQLSSLAGEVKQRLQAVLATLSEGVSS